MITAFPVIGLYEQKSRWKILLLLGALLIVGISVIYTGRLASALAEEEKENVALWANAYRNLDEADEATDIGFLFEVIRNNNTVPVILTNMRGEVLAWRNLDSIRATQNPEYVQERLENMQQKRAPILISVNDQGLQHLIYYEDSYLLTQLKWYPYVQLAIIALFLLVSYLLFSTFRTAEQNRIWVGMAKETAHQLGTPLSSMMAWMELLKEDPHIQSNYKEVMLELDKDLNRLELVADRFSKIGSTPELNPVDLNEMVEKMVAYMQKRAGKHVIFSYLNRGTFYAQVNPPLFEWVLENLIKNALDAMEGKGSIEIKMGHQKQQIWIDVKDSGKGIPRSKFQTVFQPGYSTKKRGWGLGLTLCKRIIEDYHKGELFVKESEIDQGSTFRIILPQNP